MSLCPSLQLTVKGELIVRYLLAISLLFVVGSVHSQQLPQIPQVEAEQKTESPTHSKEIVSPQDLSTCNPSSASSVDITGFPASPPKPEGKQSGEGVSEYWPPLFGYKVKITDSLLVIFTLLLWIATRGLVTGAEKTAKRQLRAYMCLENIVYERNELPLLYLRIKNFGNTPAHNIRFIWWLENEEPVTAPVCPRTMKPKPIGMFGPGQTLSVIMPDEQPNGKSWVIGLIDYEDIFGNWWTTTFCFERISIGGHFIDNIYKKWNGEDGHGNKRPY